MATLSGKGDEAALLRVAFISAAMMLTSKWEQSSPTRTQKPAGLFIIIFYIIVLQLIDL